MLNHLGFYLLRRPVQSLNCLSQLHQQLATHSFEDVLLKWYSESPQIQESIYIASPILYNRITQWLNREHISEKEQLQLTLYKYFVRMSMRATPYGLFSGCSVGTIGDKTCIHNEAGDVIHKHTNIDFEWLFALKEWLTEQPEIRQQLKLFPNTSLYPLGDHFRYVEQIRNEHQRSYFISSIESNEYIKLIFNSATKGATLDELIVQLIDNGIDYDNAHEYISELIDNKILTFEIEPTITGSHYLNFLIHKLSKLQHSQQLIPRLEALKGLLDQKDNRIEMYEKVRFDLKSLGIPNIKKDIVHVDSFFDYSRNQISEKVIDNIQRQISKLFVLNERRKNPDMDEFKRRFRNRYEDEEIPFTLALDHEIGIGYGSLSSLGASYTPMIDELSFPSTTQVSPNFVDDWWQSFLLSKYTQALQANASLIELCDSDLMYIKKQRTSNPTEDGNKHAALKAQPSTLYAFGNIFTESYESADKGDFQFNLIACKGPSAVNILSRFHEGDKELLHYLKHCVSKEEQHNKDVILAEVVHCPDSRAGNIMTRPLLHQYEIPYLGQAAVNEEFQIPVQDLMISLRSGQIVLRSKRLNKRVIPRLSNAHNYSTGLPIYRFLCDLQHQDAQLSINWNWGILDQQVYLPRVSYQNIIISRASWLLYYANFKDLELGLVKSKLKVLNLPSQFVISSGDNELLIDTNISYSLSLLIQKLRKQTKIRVVEFLPSSENCLLKHNGSSYASEVVIPFVNPCANPISGLSTTMSQIPQRKFSIGSQWLYLKIYTGESSSDTILITTLFPIITKLIDDNIINKFFFVRYKDPDPHLRLRFQGNQRLEFYHHVIRAIEDVLQQNIQTGVVYKVQVDTYHRELERYGMERIDICESIFHYDSIRILQFLSSSGDCFDENLRFAFAVNQIHNLFEKSDLSFLDRFALVNKLKERFFDEFDGDSALRKQLSAKYRNFRPYIDQVLEISQNDTIDPWIQQLRNSISDKQQLFSILSSLIHMTINRIFPSKQRAYELIVYHCMAKHYSSINATQQVEV